MGFQVIEYGIGSTKDDETFRGRVKFDQSSEQSLSGNLKENIAEIGGRKPCSLDCAAGTHTVLMTHSSSLSKC